MIISATIHGLSEQDGALDDAQHDDARELVESILASGWATKLQISGADDISDIYVSADSLGGLDEFVGTSWDVIEGAIIVQDTVDSSLECGEVSFESLETQESWTLALFKGSILRLLPNSHMYNTPSVILPPSSVAKEMPDSLVSCYFHASLPQFYPNSLVNPSGKDNPNLTSPNIHPSALENPSPLTNARWKHMRVAWLVPVRGVVPWEGTSEAFVLADDNERLNSPWAHSRDYTQPVMWTPSLLRGFWEHLVRHRSQNTLGPIGFVFLPAVRDGTNVDMIKVWCDATMAMKMRTLVSVFHVKPPEDKMPAKRAPEIDGESAEERQAREKQERRQREDALITPLRRCRLMLLGDGGEPLLVS